MDADNPNSCYWKARRSGEETNDYRTPWYRDYGRVVHSASFRRLQAKTQILGVGEGDFHRTRLTHTLEVSQIGESIRSRLHRDYRGKDNKHVRKWLPDSALIRAICLTHDLGHPPFGHDGEVALNRCMLGKGGFEGNGQTLRVITKLEKHTEAHGMNLTRRTVLGAIKYPAPHNAVNNEEAYPDYRRDLSGEPVFRAAGFEPPKCYLDDEDKDVVRGWLADGLDEWDAFAKLKSIDQGGHGKTVHKSLDASIMELADDIAYGVHDLEDTIGLKLIRRQDFEESLEECGWEGTIEPLPDGMEFGWRGFMDRLFSRHTHERKRVIGKLVDVLIRAVVIDTHPEFPTPIFRYRAALAHPEREALDTLKRIVHKRVIESVEVQRLRFKGQRIVTELFHAFATDPERLIDEWLDRLSKANGDGTSAERVIRDYIAGMTDDYATERYRQLFMPGAGSVFDRL